MNMKHACILMSVALIMALSALMPACGPPMPEKGMINGSYPEIGPKIVEGGVRFVLFWPKAKRVNIAGDFNNWSTGADPLFDREGKGMWSIVIPLQAGRYEYKFVVEGAKWVPDPGNPKKVKDGFGAFNSVVEVGP